VVRGIRITAALSFIVWIAACNSTSVNYDAELAKHVGTAREFRDLHFARINSEQSYNVHLGLPPTVTQVAQFPWGEGFVSAIEFPEMTDQFEIIVRSEHSGLNLFAPAIWFLDENFEVQSGINTSAFRFSLGAYVGNIFLNETHKHFKYMLVFADPSLSGKAVDSQKLQVAVTPIMVPINGYMVTWNVQSASAVNQQYKHAVGGKFSVAFKNYQPRNLSDSTEATSN